MSTHGSGCRWQDRGFSVYMRDTRKEPDKCLRCKRYKGRKHKECRYVDRGYYLIIKKRTK